MRHKKTVIAVGSALAAGGIFGGVFGAKPEAWHAFTQALNTPTPGLNISSYATGLVGLTALAVGVLAIALCIHHQKIKQTAMSAEAIPIGAAITPEDCTWLNTICSFFGLSQNGQLALDERNNENLVIIEKAENVKNELYESEEDEYSVSKMENMENMENDDLIAWEEPSSKK